MSDNLLIPEPIPPWQQNILLSIIAARGKYSNTVFIFRKIEFSDLILSFSLISHSSDKP